MTTQISGTNGVNQVQPGSVTQAGLGANVAGNGPAFSAYLGADQTITSSVWTKVLLNTKEYDSANSFDNVTNNRFQPSVAGYYQLNWNVANYSSTTPTRLISGVNKNGTQTAVGSDIASTSSAFNFSSGSCLVYLNGTTNYVELFAYVIATTAKVTSGLSNTKLSGFLARAA